MQMREILHPGVIKLRAMREVGGTPRRQNAVLAQMSLRSESKVIGAEGSEAAGGPGMGDRWHESRAEPRLHGRHTQLLIIRFTEHKAALIGFKFRLIGIYGELLSRKEGWRRRQGRGGAF